MNKSRIALVAAAALMLSSNAFAQFYVGAGAGFSRLNDDCAGATTCDKNDTGLKLFGGYKLVPNWALEVNYFDFGKARATVDTDAGVASVDLKGTAFGAGVMLFAAAPANWTGLARFGVARVKADVTATLGADSASEGQTSTQGYLGFGLGYAFSKNLSIDGAIDYTRAKWGGSGADLSLVSIGLTYGF
jgi:OOP family OmpA-OmpF porin